MDYFLENGNPLHLDFLCSFLFANPMDILSIYSALEKVFLPLKYVESPPLRTSIMLSTSHIPYTWCDILGHILSFVHWIFCTIFILKNCFKPKNYCRTIIFPTKYFKTQNPLVYRYQYGWNIGTENEIEMETSWDIVSIIDFWINMNLNIEVFLFFCSDWKQTDTWVNLQ